MTTLPVREIVLYKHSVAFFVRQGEVSGDSLTLSFRQDEINDVLKSLAVFDQRGGQVLGDVRDVADGKRLGKKSQQKISNWSHGNCANTSLTKRKRQALLCKTR
jgi:hypothetical protein